MKIKETRVWRLLKRILAPFGFVQDLKKKKIYGLTYVDRKDLRYQKKVMNDRFHPKRRERLKKEINSFNRHPIFSIVMPVYNVEQQWLEEAIQSALDQVYPHWELCIADDASPSPHIKSVLEDFKSRDERIKVRFLEKNLGISGASNEALMMASGDYIVLLDHDDRLSPDCLYEVTKLLEAKPDAGLIYSDEDKLSMGGLRLRPVFKKKWNPDLFMTYNYICHVVVCKKELINRAGGFRPGFEGSQDYDLLLRVTELTDKIYHIPKVLYHWRMIPGSAASVVDAKSESFERARQALKDALKRRDLDGDVLDGDTPGTFRVVPTAKPDSVTNND
jgi:O-antigen biosynthesis protein